MFGQYQIVNLSILKMRITDLIIVYKVAEIKINEFIIL